MAKQLILNSVDLIDYLRNCIMDRFELERLIYAGERDFSGVDWSGASLYNLNLTGIILVDANLTETDLQDVIFDSACLEGACFERADLNGARFQDANLRRANFDNSTLYSVYFNRCNLDDASLKGADLRKASFQGTTLKRANLEDILSDYISFTDTDFTGAKISISDVVDHRAVRVTLPSGEIYTLPRLEGENL